MKNRILNLGIMAHVDAGKTTVTESFLYHSGIIGCMGSVDKGTTTTDSLELEQKRGMTIKSTTVSFEVDGVKVNLIDTPGHMDFIAEVERSLAVLDGVILVISAKEGVQPQTRIIFHQLRKMKLPVIIFINKIDRMGVNINDIYEQIRSQLTDKYVLMQDVVQCGTKECNICDYSYADEKLTEQVIMRSEKLLDKYMNGIPITEEEYSWCILYRVQKAKIYPIYHGSALQDIGVEKLLHAITQWFNKTEYIKVPNTSIEKILSAYVYKIERDDKHHKKAFIRVFAGELRIRDKVQLCRTNSEITIKNIYQIAEGKQYPAEYIVENDIGIIYDMDELNCGDFLGSVINQKGLCNMAEPLLHVGIRPMDNRCRHELVTALDELMSEDPLLSISINNKTNEIMVNLFGRLQKEILQSMLNDRYGIQTCFDEVKTVCKEKPVQSVVCGIRRGQSGNLHHAGIELQIEPLPTGSGFIYETKVSFGFIEKSFQNAVQEGVEKGIKEGLQNEVIDVKVTFTDADYDSVTSTPADYRRLAPEVLNKALKIAGTTIMEPYMNYLLIVPMGYEKSMMTAITAMKASIETIHYTETEMQVNGIVPYDTCKDFQVDLLSMTEGRGIFEIEFLEYREVIR